MFIVFKFGRKQEKCFLQMLICDKKSRLWSDATENAQRLTKACSFLSLQKLCSPRWHYNYCRYHETFQKMSTTDTNRSFFGVWAVFQSFWLYSLNQQRTFPGFVLYVDGLGLVVAVVVLDTHQVGVGLGTEAGRHGHHMLVAVVHNLHQLQGVQKRVTVKPQ